MNNKVSNDRAVAAVMARAVMFVVFIGSGVSLVLLLVGQSSVAIPVCIGSGVIGLILLVIGAYLVARAKAA